MKSDKKLVVRFTTKGTKVTMQVLAMPERLRGKGELASTRTYCLGSYVWPQIEFNNLYLRGDLQKQDADIGTYTYKTPLAARRAVAGFRRLIRQINSAKTRREP